MNSWWDPEKIEQYNRDNITDPEDEKRYEEEQKAFEEEEKNRSFFKKLFNII